MSKRLQVLLSAYACEPGKGSEPEVGWQWARQMARWHDVTVLTRANNAEAIERSLAGQVGPRPQFLYFDLPGWLLAAKRRGLPAALYYALWQLVVRWHFRRELRSYDLVHHLTFNSLLIPGCWWFTGRRVILGPLGGGMICPWELLGEFAEQRIQELARNLLVLTSPLHPLVFLGCAFASRILAANADTAERVPWPFRRRVQGMLETGIDLSKFSTASPLEIGTKVVWAGSLIKRKGAALALRAFAKAHTVLPALRLLIIGTGPEQAYLQTLAGELGIESSVNWRGRVPHGSMPEVLREQSIFLFTSLRDTSGNVLLEAMASGMPAVILSHQGAAEIASDSTAIRVPPDVPAKVIERLADGMVRLAKSRELRMEFGRNARQRIASEYAWDRKGEAMNVVYQEVMES